ncbi:MAG TPA: cyclase family protein [Streptosporangiaceae bacterium]|nr:cyclase family protein [Streptosporangiaceae bacterium]
MSATEYRAQFDAVVTFSNGGGLRADGFRVDVPGPDVTEQDVASLFIASLNLLMVESAELRNLSVFAEPHKGTRGGPSDRPAPGSLRGRIVDLSHPIRDGLITYPGLPAPEIRPHLTRAQSRSVYEPGTEFQIDAITLVGNTGTYLDSPFHRYAEGLDLAALPLESCVELSAVLARTAGSGSRAVDVGALAALDVAGRAVLLHTGGDAAWGHADYATEAPYLSEAGARWLAERGARLVGIDSVNIDDIQGGGRRPAHSILLRAGIPVVEHLTGLSQLPPTGFRFTAAPIPLAGFGTFPTRAYATVPEP